MIESWKEFLFAGTVIVLLVVSGLGVIRFRAMYLSGNTSNENATKEQTTQHSSNSLELVERNSTEQPSYEVRPVLNRQYFDVLRRQINNADTNIKVSMYLFLPPKKGDPKRSPRGIIKALRQAASRGVKIQILLSKKDAPSVELSYVHKGVLEKLSHPKQHKKFLF